MSATFDDVTRQLEILNKTCSRIVSLLELSMNEELQRVLSGIFSNERNKKIYSLSNGTLSSRDIGKIVQADQKVISNLWKKWEGMDIVESTGKQKPYKAKYTFEELALQATKNVITISKRKEENRNGK